MIRFTSSGTQSGQRHSEESREFLVATPLSAGRRAPLHASRLDGRPSAHAACNRCHAMSRTQQIAASFRATATRAIFALERFRIR